jgi:hypothetical protein
LSIAVGAAFAIYAIATKDDSPWAIPYVPTGTWVAILFGLLAYQSWQLLQQARIWQTQVDDRLPWENDPDAWKR